MRCGSDDSRVTFSSGPSRDASSRIDIAVKLTPIRVKESHTLVIGLGGSHHMKSFSGLLAAVLVTSFAAPLSSQTQLLMGRVTDSLTTRPIAAGQVVILGTGLSASIREDGSFALSVPVRE